MYIDLLNALSRRACVLAVATGMFRYLYDKFSRSGVTEDELDAYDNDDIDKWSGTTIDKVDWLRERMAMNGSLKNIAEEPVF
jgi:hypothetical protein